jgi:LPXTG-motif cell wall-anchored protein
MEDVNLLVALGILVLLLVVAGILLTRKRRTEHLTKHFGPEYERAVEHMGSREKAEADLLAREKRVRKLDIVPLPPQDAERFRMEWQGLQGRFVDNPRSAVTEADILVRDVMARRGYPMGDFESRAADISVDHPLVVEHYRAAHAIALREREGNADTEALRQALVHYRALFAELLEVATEPARRNVADERRAEEPRRHGFLKPDRAMAREEPAPGDRQPPPRRER